MTKKEAPRRHLSVPRPTVPVAPLADQASKRLPIRVRAVSNPAILNAVALDGFAYPKRRGEHLPGIIAQIEECARTVNARDLTQPESMLTAQAIVLNTVFASLVSDAGGVSNLHVKDQLLRLAFKAQGQCRQTIETLAMMKNPPAVFAKQANIAHGHQQVNNPAVPHAGEPVIRQNELLENENVERMVRRTQGEAGRRNSRVAALDPVNRSANAGRQGTKRS